MWRISSFCLPLGFPMGWGIPQGFRIGFPIRVVYVCTVQSPIPGSYSGFAVFGVPGKENDTKPPANAPPLSTEKRRERRQYQLLPLYCWEWLVVFVSIPSLFPCGCGLPAVCVSLCPFLLLSSDHPIFFRPLNASLPFAQLLMIRFIRAPMREHFRCPG